MVGGSSNHQITTVFLIIEEIFTVLNRINY